MRSFMGRDILSLKDFERNEFFHIFEVAAELEPIARSRRNSQTKKYGTNKKKNPCSSLLSTLHSHSLGS